MSRYALYQYSAVLQCLIMFNLSLAFPGMVDQPMDRSRMPVVRSMAWTRCALGAIRCLGIGLHSSLAEWLALRASPARSHRYILSMQKVPFWFLRQPRCRRIQRYCLESRYRIAECLCVGSCYPTMSNHNRAAQVPLASFMLNASGFA